jgi:hypothetical protein
MGIVYADVRLGNDARPELEGINVTALVDRSHLVPYVSPVKVSLLGRECVTRALVFGNQVLLGAIPMEDIDLIIEPPRQKVTVNPASPNIPARRFLNRWCTRALRSRIEPMKPHPRSAIP